MRFLNQYTLFNNIIQPTLKNGLIVKSVLFALYQVTQKPIRKRCKKLFFKRLFFSFAENTLDKSYFK